MIKLIGILIIILGFSFQLDTIAVVLVAGVITGLVSGIDFMTILSTLGEAFIQTRYMTLFLLTLPVIGILERSGLKERGAECIRSMKSVSGGKILSYYMVIRTIAAALSIRLGGHVQFIRPLIYPMTESASEKTLENPLSEKQKEHIKGIACAVENYGNFYGQNVFVAGGGVLLVVGTLQELGFIVTPYSVSKSAIPVAIIAIIFSVIQNYFTDKKLKQAHAVKVEKEVK